MRALSAGVRHGAQAEVAGGSTHHAVLWTYGRLERLDRLLELLERNASAVVLIKLLKDLFDVRDLLNVHPEELCFKVARLAARLLARFVQLCGSLCSVRRSAGGRRSHAVQLVCEHSRHDP